MLTISKTRSPQYPEEEYRSQDEWLIRGRSEGEPFPFLGAEPTATWFSTSPDVERDFGVKIGTTLDFEMEFRPVYAGMLPDGRKLRCLPAVRGTRTGKQSFPVQAFDLTFSAPKCLSLLLAAAMVRRDLASIENIRRMQDLAVEKTLHRFRDQLVSSRSGRSGKVKHKGGEILAAAFTHFDARPFENVDDMQEAGDPQLHTHIYLMNTVKCGDGKYRALDASKFIRRAKDAGLWFRSYLAKLMCAAGFLVVPYPRISKRMPGAVVIEDIAPVELEFSRRSRRIQQYLDRRGWDSTSSRRRRLATLFTRHAKIRDRGGPVRFWQARLEKWMYLLPPVRGMSNDRRGQIDREIDEKVRLILKDTYIGELDEFTDKVEAAVLERTIGQLDPDDLQSSLQRLQTAGGQVAAAPASDQTSEMPVEQVRNEGVAVPRFLLRVTKRNTTPKAEVVGPPVTEVIHPGRNSGIPALEHWDAEDLVDAILALSSLPNAADETNASVKRAVETALAGMLPKANAELRQVVQEGRAGLEHLHSDASEGAALRDRIRRGLEHLRACGLVHKEAALSEILEGAEIRSVNLTRRP